MPPTHPAPGYYYHYKHDPEGPINNYAYEVMGVGHHTEDDAREIDKYVVVYRPLYEAFVYTNGKMFDIRPLTMFMETIEKGGVTKNRFSKITDESVLNELATIATKMYGV